MEIKLEKSNDDFDILRVNKEGKWIYLGSKYCHKREVDKFIEGINKEVKKVIIIGLSCGEHIREIIKNKNINVVVIEPNDKIFKFIKDNNMINDIIDSKQVTILSSNKEINDYFKKNVNGINIEEYQVYNYLNYQKVFVEEVKQAYNCVKDNFIQAITERNTQLAFADTWTKSLFNNLKYMNTSNSLVELKDKYKNVPAIIVSAGPSLEKNIDELKGFENGLIFSGGRTLQSLKGKGIKCDGLVVVDPGEISYKLVSDYIKDTKCPLFYHEGTNDRIISEYTGKKVIGTNNSFIKAIYDNKGISINKGGSVAHSMTYIAAYLGCNPIIFIGQDLAYTNGELHSNISKNKGQNYTSTKFENRNDLIIKDIYGNDVRTSVLLYEFKIQLEKIIEEFGDVKFINATEGGAFINGAENMLLRDALNRCGKNNVIPIETYLTDRNNSNKIIEELLVVEKIINMMNKNLKSGIEILNKLIDINEKNKNTDIVSLNKKLDKIDVMIKANLSKLEIFSNAIYKVMYEVNTSSEYKIYESDGNKKIIDKKLRYNRELYNKLLDIFVQNNYMIKETIDELNLRRN